MEDYFLPPFLSFDLFSTAASLPFLACGSNAMRIFHLPPISSGTITSFACHNMKLSYTSAFF